MENIRDLARKVLDDNLPPNAVYTSNQNPPFYQNEFSRLTNTNHLVLMANWEGGGRMTACNGFVNWYAQQIGIKDITNWFNLKQALGYIYKTDAWVEPAAGLKPKYGDILRHKKYHVDVALDFEGPYLVRAAAGQGDGTEHSMHRRPPFTQEALLSEYDVLRRVRGDNPYDPAKLEGWLDIELYFSSPQFVPVPEWLVGWWKIYWRGQDYYYYFDRDYVVKWTQIRPPTWITPIGESGKGTFSVDYPFVTTKWDDTGTIERFAVEPLSDDRNMAGMLNEIEIITAVKM